MYQKLCSTTCEIPIGIYRTQDTLACDSSHYSVNLMDEARDNHAQMIERAEIANLVRSRMESLSLPSVEYDDVSEKRSNLSYVIINPSCDLKLEEGDIIYLIRPSPFSAQKTFERHNSRRKSNISFCTQQQLASMGIGTGGGSGIPGRRGSGIFQRPPPLSTKANSLSLPDSPTVAGACRSRSNSLRVDDILLRRSNSLRQGLVAAAAAAAAAKQKDSFDDIGIDASAPTTSGTSATSGGIKIALNGSIGLEVTPPEEGICMTGAGSMGNLGSIGGGIGGGNSGMSAEAQHLQGTIV
ncbi:hypothetical protein J437_LFUL014525 [Ladona fulva]|uniref:Potassium channel subfamily T member 1 n=1 Tax=Ladona fulva TaxID=123851 RepID=A0A8K0JVH9_LADFU|nr:hypothetical protein J437_LFUL014525 [Ladona fulva]